MRKFIADVDRGPVRIAGGMLAAAVLAAVLIAPNAADAQKRDMAKVSFSNAANDPILLTAWDVNDKDRKIFDKKKIKHNEQISGEMLIDKDNNGRVRYEAELTDVPSSKKKCMKYEGKQLSRGHTFNISAINNC